MQVRWWQFGVAAAGAYAGWRFARSRKRDRFDGRTVVITGGSRGLGLALGIEFAARGASIALLGRNSQTLDRAALRLRAIGATAVTVPVDVRVADDVVAALRDVERQLGPIDVLVNNAGTIAVGPIESMTRRDYEDALATHFWGAYNTVSAVWPSFVARHAGRIVNVASIGGRISVPHLLPYSVSKFALVGYSEGLRAEGARLGIQVTTVTPGLMRTGSPRNAYFKGRAKAEYAWFKISDTLPMLSVAASRAARIVADAVARGDSSVEIGLPAIVAARVHGMAPGLFARAMGVAARLLPPASGDGDTARRLGANVETAITASPFTALGRKAEREYNQR
jgi:NAD(P)-dependent dehydrogenase (short-subunit alcohol dehydrogenase family)